MADRLVIIPTYNEIDNIETMLYTVLALEPPFEVLIVDDNSPDGTAQVVQRIQQEYPEQLHLLEREGKSGLGVAYMAGFQWALERGYEYIFEMDCDFSHNPKDLPRLLAACREQGADLAIGSRYVTGVNVVNWPMSRVLLSYFASVYVRLITGMQVHDATAGFKCYRAKVLRAVLQEPIGFVGYAFQIEMKFRAHMYGFNIQEVPIIFTDRQQGKSKMSKKIIREAILGVIELKVRSWFKRWRLPATVANKPEKV
jgi:dolichol-phosphate mannosyltransferase